MEQSLSLKTANTRKRTACFQKHFKASQCEYWWVKKRTSGFPKGLSELQAWTPLHLNDDLGSVSHVRLHSIVAVRPGAVPCSWDNLVSRASGYSPGWSYPAMNGFIKTTSSWQFHPCYSELLSTDMLIWSWETNVIWHYDSRSRWVIYGTIKII